MPRDATKTESGALAFCDTYAQKHGRAPTVREVMDGIGVQNPAAASRALRRHVQAAYEKAFANDNARGLDAQLLQRIQELQAAAAEVGQADLAREREEFAAVKVAKDAEITRALADRDQARQAIETIQHEFAVFEARTTAELAAKSEQIAALDSELAESKRTCKTAGLALTAAREASAETNTLLRHANAVHAQQLLEAEERHDSAVNRQVHVHEAEKRRLADNISVAERDQRRAEDNLVVTNTKLELAQKSLEQLRRQAELAQIHLTAKAVAERAMEDARTRAEKAETEAGHLRAEASRASHDLASSQAENLLFREQAETKQRRPRSGKP